MLVDDVDSAWNFVISIFFRLVLLMILPYFIGFMINWMKSVIGFVSMSRDKKNSGYKRNRRATSNGRVLSLITLPGTLTRMSVIMTFLRLKGWDMFVSYPGPVGSLNRGITDQRRSGFFISMRPGKRGGLNFREVVQVSLLSYIPVLLAYFMWITRERQIDYMIYLAQGNVNIIWIYFWYFYIIFALLIGGAPIPEETMLPIYYLIGRYPHLILGLIASYFLSFLVSLMELGYLGFEGNRLASTYFLLFSSILFFRVVINENAYHKITRKGLDERLLEMEVMELL